METFKGTTYRETCGIHPAPMGYVIDASDIDVQRSAGGAPYWRQWIVSAFWLKFSFTDRSHSSEDVAGSQLLPT
jgi:hypothetical protein